MSKAGGKRKGAGRKPGEVKTKVLSVRVPEEYVEQIKEKTIQIAQAYEEKCKKN